MSLPTVVSTAALVVAVAAGAVLYNKNQALEERLAALEGPRDEAADAAPGEVAGPALSGGAMKRDVAELRGLTEALVTRMEAVERRAAEAGAAPVAAPELARSLVESRAFHEAVRNQVLDMARNDVDFRARVNTGERTHLGKDPAFARVADVLKLDASQEDRFSKDLQATQQELFTLLQEERDDGVNPMEMIAKAEALPDGDPKKGEIFMKLFTLKIPGGEETYMQRVVKLQAKFRKTAETYLRPEQIEIWNSVELNIFDVKFN